MTSPIDRIEYEAMLFGRHLATLPAGRSRRKGGRLDQSAYTLLSLLDAGGPASLSELAVATGLDVSTLNRQTAAMTKAGYVERVPDPEGGLARKFRLTAVGADRLESDRHANMAGLRRVLVDWTGDDVDTFATLLRRFNTDIERLDGRPWPRD